MAARWHRTADLAGLPGLPSTRSIRLHGPGRGFISRKVKGGLEWLEDSLPDETVAALNARAAPSLPADGPMTILDARLEILQAFERWRSDRGLSVVPAMRRFAAEYKAGEDPAGISAEARALVPEFSWNTLQRWRTRFLKKGTSGLEHKVTGRKSVLDTDPEMAAIVEGQIWDKYPHVSATGIRDVIEEDLPGREVPSIRAIQRWCAAFIDANARELSAWTNPDRHRSHRKPAFGQADADIVELNQLWELDSTRIDVMCADGRRHALIACIDIFSRRARCLVAPQSTSAGIAALVRRCILEFGVPGMISTDGGQDYVSRHLRRAMADLEVPLNELPPYSPELKPYVERFIGTISRGLFAQLPGFTGHSVADREALRSRRSFAARRGQKPVVVFQCDLTPEELQEKIDAWCEYVYERRPHKGLDGETPFAKAASWRGVRKTVDPRALDILLAKPAGGDGVSTVTKKGIDVDGGRYIAPELGDLVGLKVDVRRDTDYGRIHVFREGVFICIAEDQARLGQERRQEVAAQAKARARAADNAARKHAREMIRATEADTAIDRVLDKAGRDADRVIQFPVPTQEHTGEMIDAAAEAAAALDEAGPARAGDDGAGSRHIDSFIDLYLGGSHE
ncbi:MAG: DDE-type integrase/transposase/recombinase [Gammaproteobacteria bacterium]|nr:DDE-type integrase/transposase/recombinase [Gammaproteobacteria bacterium]